MAQKEYHNYPIGTTIYPRDNSFQKLLETTPDWDGTDHTDNLYLQPCVIHSEEYKFTPDAWYFDGQSFPVVNVLYKGGVYRVNISEFWNLTTPPDLIDEIDDYYYDECPF